MKKFFINLYYLIKIKSPKKFLINFVKNFFLNYKTKKKSNKLSIELYKNFVSKYNHFWFCTHLHFLNSNLKHKNSIKDILEIGSYEGLSAIFFLNLFKHSNISCVDTWGGGEQQPGEDFSYIERNFDQNVSSYKSRLRKNKMTSDNFFKNNNEKFDLIFVDGDHHYNQVLKDASNAWKVLNSKGILIFDDYTYNHFKDNIKLNPAFAINEFINNHINDIEKYVIWKQVIIFRK